MILGVAVLVKSFASAPTDGDGSDEDDGVDDEGGAEASVEDGGSSFTNAKMVSSSPMLGAEGAALVVVEGAISAVVFCPSWLAGVGGVDEVSGGGCADVVDSGVEGKEGGREVRDIRYWNPWHPPDSTEMRSAKFGFLSLTMICESFWSGGNEGFVLVGVAESRDGGNKKGEKRCARLTLAARGVISKTMSLPSSSFCGLYTTWVLRQGAVALKCRRAVPYGTCDIAFLSFRTRRFRARPRMSRARWKARVRGGNNTSRIGVLLLLLLLLLLPIGDDDAHSKRTNNLAAEGEDPWVQRTASGGGIFGAGG